MLRHRLSFARRFVRREGRPVNITFFVTGRCAFKCRTCFYWHHINEDAAELSFGEIEQLAPQLKGVLWLQVTGGEPFLRDDLPGLMDTFARKTQPAYIALVTSGFYPEGIEPAVAGTLRSEPDLILRVSISLDAVGDLHDDIRGVPGSFRRAVESLETLVRLQERYPTLQILVPTTYSALNQDRIEELPLFLQRDFPSAHWDFSLVRGVSREPASQQGLDLDRYFALKRKYCLGRTGDHPGRFERLIELKNQMLIEVQEEVVRTGRSSLPCRAGSLSAVLREQGDVIACELREFLMGNIREHGGDFRRLWRSEQARRTREMIGAGKCHCRHECNLTTNLFFSRPHMVRLALRSAGLLSGRN